MTVQEWVMKIFAGGVHNLNLQDEVAAAIDAAVAEERERCAKIVESYEGDDWPHAAAAAIRGAAINTANQASDPA